MNRWNDTSGRWRIINCRNYRWSGHSFDASQITSFFISLLSISSKLCSSWDLLKRHGMRFSLSLSLLVNWNDWSDWIIIGWHWINWKQWSDANEHLFLPHGKLIGGNSKSSQKIKQQKKKEGNQMKRPKYRCDMTRQCVPKVTYNFDSIRFNFIGVPTSTSYKKK